MLNKFIDLIVNDSGWTVEHDGIRYKASKIKEIILTFHQQIISSGVKIDAGKYIVAVGFSPFDYFIYTLYGSLLGLKVIFSDAKFLGKILDYSIELNFIISTRKIDSKKNTVIYLDLDLANINDVSVDFDGIKSNSEAEIIFQTSGTTSDPKLVVYRESRLLENAKLVGEYLMISKKDMVLCFFPTNYMYGFSMLMSTICKGGTIILERPTLSSEEIFQYLSRGGITYLPIIRKVIAELMSLIKAKNKPIYFPELTIINASDKIYVENVKDILTICPVFSNNFGQTESGPRIFSLKINKNDDIDKYSYNDVIALGRPISKEISVFITNDHHHCHDGEIGELSYCTPFSMAGYLDRHGKINAHSKIFSGDLVFQDKDGYVFWVGRKNQTTKLNGRLINISLIHKHIEKLNSIRKCYFVIDGKENIFGFVIVNKESKDSLEKIKECIHVFYRQSFPTYPRINEIFFVDDIPCTETGKVMVSKLKEFVCLENIT